MRYKKLMTIIKFSSITKLASLFSKFGVKVASLVQYISYDMIKLVFNNALRLRDRYVLACSDLVQKLEKDASDDTSDQRKFKMVVNTFFFNRELYIFHSLPIHSRAAHLALDYIPAFI